MELKIIYEDENLKVIDKQAGINSDDFEKRIHRLDKDTSGILLIAKNDKALDFLQKQFQERKVTKKYITLVSGNLKDDKGMIEVLLGRSKHDKRKQKVFLPQGPDSKKKRKSITKYKLLKRFKDYTLIEVDLMTGRKHQIRCLFAHLSHPIIGDKLYGFKNQPQLSGLKRQFLHATQLRIKLLNGKIKEFKSELPKDLKKILNNLK